jgi:hypothetical protein
MRFRGSALILLPASLSPPPGGAKSDSRTDFHGLLHILLPACGSPLPSSLFAFTFPIPHFTFPPASSSPVVMLEALNGRGLGAQP